MRNLKPVTAPGRSSGVTLRISHVSECLSRLAAVMKRTAMAMTAGAALGDTAMAQAQKKAAPIGAAFF
jgi:hypothetical protein